MPKRKRTTRTESAPRAEWINWSQIGSSTRGPDDLLHHVRLVHKPIWFFKYHVNGKSAIVADAANPIARKYGIKPRRRYAVNMIDRATKTAKILEGAESLFLHFRRFFEVTGVDPGGPDACDFKIDTIRDKGRIVYKVTYDINARTPFTDEEKALLRGGFIDLSSVFRPMPYDEVERRLGLAHPNEARTTRHCQNQTPQERS